MAKILTLADYVNEKKFHPINNPQMICKRFRHKGNNYVTFGDKPYGEHSSLTDDGLILFDGKMTFMFLFKNFVLCELEQETTVPAA